MAEDDVDFVVLAHHQDDRWHVLELPPRLGEDFAGLVDALSHFSSDVGVLAMASVNDDFFIIVRQQDDRVRMLLSDFTAALDWPIAADLVDELKHGIPDEDSDPVPFGDLEILRDLGVTSVELELLCTDDDLYPDDVLLDIGDQLGFGDQLSAIVG